jgi:hypothetical protein
VALVIEANRNPAARRTSTVPRHREVDDFLARKICRDPDVPQP